MVSQELFLQLKNFILQRGIEPDEILMSSLTLELLRQENRIGENRIHKIEHFAGKQIIISDQLKAKEFKFILSPNKPQK